MWLYLFLLSFIINTGMWFERFVIVVTSLYRDYLPSSWGTYRATKWDYMIVRRNAGDCSRSCSCCSCASCP